LYLAPQIRFLDYQKVKDPERTKAKEIFGTHEAPTEAAQSILAASANKSLSYTAPLANGTSKQPRVKLSDKEKARVEELIKNAKSLAEVARLEKEISEGRIPAGVLDSDVMDET
jgi:U2 small nuclear ribonucleoprotein A'